MSFSCVTWLRTGDGRRQSSTLIRLRFKNVAHVRDDGQDSRNGSLKDAAKVDISRYVRRRPQTHHWFVAHDSQNTTKADVMGQGHSYHTNGVV